MDITRLSSFQDLNAILEDVTPVSGSSPSTNPRQVRIYSYELAKLLRRTVNIDECQCNRIKLNGVHLLGPLDLSGAGKLGVPIIPFELINCRLEGGIETSHAYMQGIIIKNCSLVPADYTNSVPKEGRPATLVGKIGEPSRLRFTGATISEKVEVYNLSGPADTVIDFSHSTLLHGCLLQNVGGDADGETSCSESVISCKAIACVTFANAVIAGGLKLCGLHIHAKEHDNSAPAEITTETVQTTGPDGVALNCTELQLQGSLHLGSTHLQGCTLRGQFALTGANIRGDVRCRGICAIAHLWKSEPDPPVTIAASGLRVGGSLNLWNDLPSFPSIPSIPIKPAERSCTVIGQIDLSEAHIGGDLEFAGDYHAVDHTRMVNAKSVEVKGDVRFGWILGKKRSRCSVEGEVDFSNAQIGGKFVVSGANLLLNHSTVCVPGAKVCDEGPVGSGRAPRRWAKFAVKLVGATVHNSVLLQGANQAPATVEGFALTGASIGGQLVIEGVIVQSVSTAIVPFRHGKARKAISANGVTIRGGIYISEEAVVPTRPGDDPLDQGTGRAPRQTQILGDFRLRNALVHGPAIFRGVKIASSDGRTAFWASGATFGSDLIFLPTESAVTQVEGEVRIWGATVQGNLKFEGVHLTAGEKGVALDASLVSVGKAVYVGETTEASGLQAKKSTTVQGLINLNYINCALLTLGADPPTGPVDASSPASLLLRGAILLREARVKGPVVLSELELKPCEEMKRSDPSLTKLKELAIFRPRILLYAVYAELGTRLFVRLKRTSDGEISLYGARTGTIGALHTGEIQVGRKQDLVDEDWGEKPKQVKYSRAGNPDLNATRGPSIILNLDQFHYDRLHDKTETDEDKDKEEVSWYLRRLWTLIGRPSTKDVLPRHGWLRHQISNLGMPSELVTWPYRQLAKVYRDMGDLKLAYVYEVERRWLEVRHTQGRWVQRSINFFFGLFFGFGYSSARALAWLLLWLAGFSLLLYLVGAGHGSNPSACSLVGHKTIPAAIAEAFRQLLPDSLKLNTGSNCTFTHFAGNNWTNKAFFVAFGVGQFMGRVLVIGATLTFTGVLQEKAPVATSMKQ